MSGNPDGVSVNSEGFSPSRLLPGSPEGAGAARDGEGDLRRRGVDAPGGKILVSRRRSEEIRVAVPAAERPSLVRLKVRFKVEPFTVPDRATFDGLS
jgi:hypothetical protein